MLTFFLKPSDKFLLKLSKEYISPLNFSLETLICRIQVNSGFCKFQRYVIDMLRELLMVVITIVTDPIYLFLECVDPHIDLFAIPFRTLQVFTDIGDLFSVLIQESLSVYQYLVDLVVHLAYFCDILIIIIFNYIHNGFLFLVKGISYLVDVVIRFLNQLTIQFDVDTAQSVDISLNIVYLVAEHVVLHLLGSRDFVVVVSGRFSGCGSC